jgi:hypothetical protein
MKSENTGSAPFVLVAFTDPVREYGRLAFREEREQQYFSEAYQRIARKRT